VWSTVGSVCTPSWPCNMANPLLFVGVLGGEIVVGVVASVDGVVAKPATLLLSSKLFRLMVSYVYTGIG